MREITTSKEKMRFIMSVVYACHQFGKEVCVEGVETKEELDIVRQTELRLYPGILFLQASGVGRNASGFGVAEKRRYSELEIGKWKVRGYEPQI